MTIQLRGNNFFVGPNDKKYKISSNYTNYVEIGDKEVTEYYLKGEIRNKEEFIINATLPDSESDSKYHIDDNFPREEYIEKVIQKNGFDILDSTGKLLIGIRVDGDTCLLRGKVFDGDGNVVAEQKGDDFVVHQGPLVLGKSGSSRGLVVN